MNKVYGMVLALSFGSFALAQSIQVNATASGPFVDDQTLMIEGGSALTAQTSTVIAATLTMSLPSTTPTVVADDLLAVTCDTDGTLLVSDLGQWKRSTLQVTEGQQVAMSAVATLSSEDKATFKVTLTTSVGAETLSVTSSKAQAALTQIVGAGTGTMDKLSIAQVPTSILPTAGDDTQQDPELVTSYVAWDQEMGQQLPADVTDVERQDAFAMNVSARNPTLTITDINTTEGTITIHGAIPPATESGEETAIALPKINGVLVITYADTLTGTPQKQTIDVSTSTDKDVKIAIPEGAKFLRARVYVVEPTDVTL